MGKVQDTGDCVTIEDFVEGEFFKYVNNDGAISASEHEICLKAQYPSHYSFEKTDRKLMLVDIQDAGKCYLIPKLHPQSYFQAELRNIFPAMEIYLPWPLKNLLKNMYMQQILWSHWTLGIEVVCQVSTV